VRAQPFENSGECDLAIHPRFKQAIVHPYGRQITKIRSETVQAKAGKEFQRQSKKAAGHGCEEVS
jgi:hypothetical protein